MEFQTKTENLTCSNHGDYVGNYVFMNNQWRGGLCHECANERRIEIDKIEKERLEKENESKRQKSFNDKLSRSGITNRFFDKTLNNYKADTEPKLKALNAINDMADKINSGEKCNNLILSGSVGTGKTHLCCGLIRAISENHNGEIITARKLVRDFKETWRSDSEYTETQIIDHFSKLDLLVIDEIGVQFNSDTERLFMFDILDERYQSCLPTILVSNLDVNQIKLIMGDRVVDRLREDGGKVIAFNWDSFRGLK